MLPNLTADDKVVIPWRGLRSLGGICTENEAEPAPIGSNPLAGIEVFGSRHVPVALWRVLAVVIPWRGLRSLGEKNAVCARERRVGVVIPWRGLRSLGGTFTQGGVEFNWNWVVIPWRGLRSLGA